MAVYYFGYEGKVGMGYEHVEADDSSVSFGEAVTADNEISWIRGITVAVDENVTREFFVGQTTKRDADETLKGIHEATGTITMWLPDDMYDASMANDIAMLKLPIDSLGFNNNGTSFTVPSAAHGCSTLQSFTLEVGHEQKTWGHSDRYLTVSGCTVGSFTFRARAGENIECSMDWQGKGVTWASGSAAMQSPTRSTREPLNFGNCEFKFGASGSEAAVDEVTGFEFTIDNNLIPIYGLADQQARVPSDMIPGKRDITGTITVHMASGNVTNDLFSKALSGTTPSPHVENNAINFVVEGTGASGSFTYYFYNVVIPDLSMDIDPTKIQEISVPFGAEEVMLKIFPKVSTALPTNWLAA